MDVSLQAIPIPLQEFQWEGMDDSFRSCGVDLLLWLTGWPTMKHSDQDTDAITILKEFRRIFSNLGLESEIEAGSVCLTRIVSDPSVKRKVLELSAACAIPRKTFCFRLRCTQKIDGKNGVIKYNLILNDHYDRTLAEEGLTPERGPHRAEFKGGNKQKSVHIPTSGKLEDIAERFLQEIEKFK